MNLKIHITFNYYMTNNSYYEINDLKDQTCSSNRTSDLSIYTNESNDVVKKLIKEHEKMIHDIDIDHHNHHTFTDGVDRRQGTFTDGVDRRQGTFTDGVDRRQGTFTDGVDRRQGTNEKEHSGLLCELCKDPTFNKKGCKKNYIILSCNHIFHIYCLAQSHYKKITTTSNENDSFDNCTCTICNEKLELEQIMYLHSTFMSNTKNLLSTHQNSIEHLEGQLQQLKLELRTLYNYKYKLEKEREKSKQIMCILNTML